MISGLESAKSKLTRAGKHLRAIERCISLYAASHPHKLTKTKGKKSKKLTIPKVPPRGIAILAGEMVYQMRSALDHLVFELVGLNASKLPADWFKHCEFPLYMVRSDVNVPEVYRLGRYAPSIAFRMALTCRRRLSI
jgi:hypothetical protein